MLQTFYAFKKVVKICNKKDGEKMNYFDEYGQFFLMLMIFDFAYLFVICEE